MGYTSMTNFAKGIGNYEGDMFNGWKGNKTVGQETFLDNAVNFKNFSQIVLGMALQKDGVEIANSLEINERKFRYPDGKCFDINITIGDDLGLEKVVDLTVWFNEDEWR